MAEHEANATVAPGEREQRANEVVGTYVKWSVVAGLIPLPIVDFAAVAALQVKMLSELSSIYGVPFTANRTKTLIGALVGGAVPTDLAWGGLGSLIKAVPLVGTTAGVLTMPAFGGAATYAVGKVFIQHFESGGTFLDFKPEEVKGYYAQQFEAGKLSPAVRDAETKAARAKPATAS